MIRKRTRAIRNMILREVVHHSNDIASHIGNIFDISRQSVNKHLKSLVDEGYLVSKGSTRSKVYFLGERRLQEVTLPLKGLREHEVYYRHFNNVVDGLPGNIEEIISYGFTEILNNAIDHSSGEVCRITMKRDSNRLSIVIADDGEGIFKKITRELGLYDEHLALLELSKGKLTTDPANHSGQGIFFTSRSFDHFDIYSFGMNFSHDDSEKLDLLYKFDDDDVIQGTVVMMDIDIESKRVLKDVFDEYSGTEEEEFGFNKTVVPVRLARFGEEQLVSRSQAKRVLSRVENFRFVIMDFEDVDSIGQAFADEIFRVYRLRHPEVLISPSNTSLDVDKMIRKAIRDSEQVIQAF